MITINAIERYLFLEGIFLKYGYDFRQYAEASLDRRLSYLLMKYNTTSLFDILKKVINSEEEFQKLLPELTINTTEFFRDPQVFLSMKRNVFPVLKTYSRLNIWCAGCSTGEEIISLAILLHEAGLLERTTLYATDINANVLKKAKSGIFEFDTLNNFNRNYVLAGGEKSPSEYYTAEYGLARFDPQLLSNVVFSEHNLVTDSRFIQAHLILCRNVLIYFNRQLQDRIFGLFAKTLAFKGFLTLGSKESLSFTSNGGFFEPIDSKHNIYSLKAKLVAERDI